MPLALVVGLLALYPAEEPSAASIGVRELTDKRGTVWAPDPASAFGVNGTRLRWHGIEGKSWTLDLLASTNSVTSRWPAGHAFSAGRSASRSEGGGLSRYNTLLVGNGRRGGEIEEFQTPDEGPGGYLAAPHALGPYIAYGWYETWMTVRGSCDADGFGCAYKVRRGGLRLIEGLRRGRLVTNAPVAALSLSSTGTVAYVRATTRWHNWPRYGNASVIEVTTLWSPRVLQRIRAPGKVTDLAVTDRVLAVRLQTKTHWSVVFLDLWSGRELRVIRLKSEWGGSLALRDSTAVMFMGRKLVELDTYSGAKRVIGRIRAEAGGLAFAGDTLVWYEQYRSGPKPRYRVMSATL